MTDRRHTSMYADKEKSIVLNMYKFVIIDAHTFLDTQTFYTLSWLLNISFQNNQYQKSSSVLFGRLLRRFGRVATGICFPFNKKG